MSSDVYIKYTSEKLYRLKIQTIFNSHCTVNILYDYVYYVYYVFLYRSYFDFKVALGIDKLFKFPLNFLRLKSVIKVINNVLTVSYKVLRRILIWIQKKVKERCFYPWFPLNTQLRVVDVLY